jgi:hypothetical protein
MSKWLLTLSLRDLDDLDETAVLDAVRWALEDSVETQAMVLLSLTIAPDEAPGRGRALQPHYVEPDCDPTTGVCHYGKLD